MKYIRQKEGIKIFIVFFYKIKPTFLLYVTSTTVALDLCQNAILNSTGTYEILCCLPKVYDRSYIVFDFHPFQTPGRLTHMLGQGDASMNQEYVVFDPRQVLPLCLLSYETM